jgi:hypothetical protein
VPVHVRSRRSVHTHPKQPDRHDQQQDRARDRQRGQTALAARNQRDHQAEQNERDGQGEDDQNIPAHFHTR